MLFMIIDSVMIEDVVFDRFFGQRGVYCVRKRKISVRPLYTEDTILYWECDQSI